MIYQLNGCRDGATGDGTFDHLACVVIISAGANNTDDSGSRDEGTSYGTSNSRVRLHVIMRITGLVTGTRDHQIGLEYTVSRSIFVPSRGDLGPFPLHNPRPHIHQQHYLIVEEAHIVAV